MKGSSNGSVENGSGNSNGGQVSLDRKRFKGIEGSNRVKVDISGGRGNGRFGCMGVYYGCSKLGKSSEEDK